MEIARTIDGQPVTRSDFRTRRERENGITALLSAALEWRFVVRHLYVELDRPAVPGYTAERVRRVLWGGDEPDGDFFAALLTALTARAKRSWSPSVTVFDDLKFDLDIAVPPLLMDWGWTDKPEGVNVFREKPDLPEKSNVTRWKHASAHDAKPEPPKRSYAPPPPNPDLVQSVDDFMAALGLLKRWTGMSLRQLEERSKQVSGSWLPRTTAADMLRRRKLPRAATLWAFTAACGLSESDRTRWEAARERIHAARATVVAAEDDADAGTVRP